MTILYVALGGACGASLRWLFGRWTLRVLGPDFPWGTLGVNVIGSFVMGLAAVLLMERVEGGWARFAPFVMTGLLGGFTTFSAFSLETITLIERGQTGTAALYVTLSVVCSVGGLFLAMSAARMVLS